jgi:hypothetical protein
MSRFLGYAVRLTLEGKSADLKVYSIGLEVFDRKPSFDPRLDPIVRVEARRLRKKLDEYYDQERAGDPVRIRLPKEGYAVQFEECANAVGESQEQAAGAPRLTAASGATQAEGAAAAVNGRQAVS